MSTVAKIKPKTANNKPTAAKLKIKKKEKIQQIVKESVPFQPDGVQKELMNRLTRFTSRSCLKEAKNFKTRADSFEELLQQEIDGAFKLLEAAKSLQEKATTVSEKEVMKNLLSPYQIAYTEAVAEKKSQACTISMRRKKAQLYTELAELKKQGRKAKKPNK